jgi:hypothetical protein
VNATDKSALQQRTVEIMQNAANYLALRAEDQIPALRCLCRKASLTCIRNLEALGLTMRERDVIRLEVLRQAAAYRDLCEMQHRQRKAA